MPPMKAYARIAVAVGELGAGKVHSAWLYHITWLSHVFKSEERGPELCLSRNIYHKVP
jgi:hypothetical protein